MKPEQEVPFSESGDFAGAAETIVTPAVHVESDYRLTGRIVRLEHLLQGGASRVTVEIELVLTKREGRELLLLETYREERSAPEAGVAASVTAYDQAISAIFERFAADIPRS